MVTKHTHVGYKSTSEVHALHEWNLVCDPESSASVRTRKGNWKITCSECLRVEKEEGK